MKKFVLLLGLLILSSFNLPVYANGSVEEYKCDLMIKGYEFSNNGLSEAIIKNDQEAIELFVKADININLPDKEGYSALDRALKVKDKEAVVFLSHAGGETRVMEVPDEFAQLLDDKNENGTTKIEGEEAENSFDSIASKIAFAKDKSSEKQTKKQEGQQNLCELINKNDVEAVADFPKKSPELNQLTEDGLCPVHYAIFNDSPEMVHLLLCMGANVNGKTNDGLTPLDIAVLNDQKIVAQVIMEYGGALSEQVAKELAKFGCPVQKIENSDLYDASYEDIFSAVVKIQQKLNSQK